MSEPRRMTLEALKLDAALGVLEALQVDGYFLHDRDGHVLDKQQFTDAVVKAFNVVLASPDKTIPYEPEHDQAWLRR